MEIPVGLPIIHCNSTPGTAIRFLPIMILVAIMVRYTIPLQLLAIVSERFRQSNTPLFQRQERLIFKQRAIGFLHAIHT